MSRGEKTQNVFHSYGGECKITAISFFGELLVQKRQSVHDL